MYQLQAVTGFFLVLTAMTSVRLNTVDALIQGRCRPEYQNLPSGVTHTACKGPNPRCTLERALTGLSPQIKQQALQVHNDYRSQVAQGRLQNFPPAKNMYELEWDDEIAEVAQAFAEQCDYSRHDENEARLTRVYVKGLRELKFNLEISATASLAYRCSYGRFKHVAQNFGWAVDYARNNVTEGKTWVDDWFIEYRDYSPNAVASFGISTATGVVTHFTQMIWAETRYIGCGYSNFQKDGKYGRLFACNYAPRGNEGGKPIYLAGRTCSECPAGSSCNPATGLCRGGGSGPVRTPVPPPVRPPVPPPARPPVPPPARQPVQPPVRQPVPPPPRQPVQPSARCRPEYRNLPNGVTHTACKGPNPRCTLDRALTGLSPQVKQQALQVHNDYRSQVAQGRLQNYPAAKNMYELEWDDEMAEVAQAFAEQCQHISHDLPEARTTSRFKSVGQNFGWADDLVKQANTEGKTWADDWFIEYRDYNPNAVASFDTRTSRGVVTHFTQMIWAETRYIGCGFSNFFQGNRYTRIFVCNYAPAWL